MGFFFTNIIFANREQHASNSTHIWRILPISWWIIGGYSIGGVVSGAESLVDEIYITEVRVTVIVSWTVSVLPWWPRTWSTRLDIGITVRTHDKTVFVTIVQPIALTRSWKERNCYSNNHNSRRWNGRIWDSYEKGVLIWIMITKCNGSPLLNIVVVTDNCCLWQIVIHRSWLSQQFPDVMIWLMMEVDVLRPLLYTW